MEEELLSIELNDPELQPLSTGYVIQRVEALEAENAKLKEYTDHKIMCELKDNTLEMDRRKGLGYVPECSCGLKQVAEELQAKDDIIASYENGPGNYFEQKKQIVKLMEALKSAKETIRLWQFDTRNPDVKLTWDAYNERPEMKIINEAIQLASNTK